jgi:hypothetical protein
MIGNLIYDIGMNNGDDTAYYLQRGFRVIAVEANPALVSQAIQRFERIWYEKDFSFWSDFHSRRDG